MFKQIEIPCGRYDYDPQTKRVSIVKAKGVLVLQLNEENELRLQWLNIDQNNKIEIDRYIFNNDAKFQKVKGQNRVYYLSFQSEDSKLFFYMQNSDSSLDEEHCAKFNDLVSRQVLDDPAPISQDAAPQTPSQPIQQQTQQQFAPQPGFNQQQILSLMSQMMQQQTQGQFSLSEVASLDFLHSLLEDEAALARLIPHLPEGQQNAEHMRENLLGPQLRQAMDQLSMALRDQDRAALLTQLGVDQQILQQEFDGVLAFLKGIMKIVDNEKQRQRQE